jgi:molecular chaperone GrpE (heat shock protein)
MRKIKNQHLRKRGCYFYTQKSESEEKTMAEETKQEPNGTEPTAKTYTEAEYNALQEQLTAMQSQLSTANETIQSYKDMDIDGIQASVAEYKQKWEQSEADRKAFEYQTRLGQYVKILGLRDDIYEQHVANLLAGKNLQSSYFCATSSQSARNRYSDNNFPRMT